MDSSSKNPVATKSLDISLKSVSDADVTALLQKFGSEIWLGFSENHGWVVMDRSSGDYSDFSRPLHILATGTVLECTKDDFSDGPSGPWQLHYWQESGYHHPVAEQTRSTMFELLQLYCAMLDRHAELREASLVDGMHKSDHSELGKLITDGDTLCSWLKADGDTLCSWLKADGETVERPTSRKADPALQAALDDIQAGRKPGLDIPNEKLKAWRDEIRKLPESKRRDEALRRLDAFAQLEGVDLATGKYAEGNKTARVGLNDEYGAVKGAAEAHPDQFGWDIMQVGEVVGTIPKGSAEARAALSSTEMTPVELNGRKGAFKVQFAGGPETRTMGAYDGANNIAIPYDPPPTPESIKMGQVQIAKQVADFMEFFKKELQTSFDISVSAMLQMNIPEVSELVKKYTGNGEPEGSYIDRVRRLSALFANEVTKIMELDGNTPDNISEAIILIYEGETYSGFAKRVRAFMGGVNTYSGRDRDYLPTIWDLDKVRMNRDEFNRDIKDYGYNKDEITSQSVLDILGERECVPHENDRVDFHPQYNYVKSKWIQTDLTKFLYSFIVESVKTVEQKKIFSSGESDASTAKSQIMTKCGIDAYYKVQCFVYSMGDLRDPVDTHIPEDKQRWMY